MNNVRIGPNAAVLISALLLLLLFSVNAHAEVSNTNMLNGIVEKINSSTEGMASKLVDFATTLFWSLAVIRMVFTFGFMLMRRADIGEFFAELCKFIITIGFFWWLLTNAVTGMNIAGTIIESMRNMGAQASGLGRELSPSGIVDVGFNVLFTVSEASLGIADKLLAYAVAVIILLIFAAVAVNMVLVLAESWFMLYGGLFVLGLGGGIGWTSEIAIGYYRQVLGIGFKLFGMAVIVGVGKGFIDGFVADLSGKPGILELAVILVAAYVFFKLSDRIPSMMAGLISGGGSGGGFTGGGGGGGGVSAAGMAGAAIAAVGGVAAIATTVAKMLGGQEGAALGGASALMKAVSAANQALSTDSISAGFSGWGGSSSDSSGNKSQEHETAKPREADPTFDENYVSGVNDNGEVSPPTDDEVSAFANRDK
ncbi:P-type conjugative transfer protein TrbL [Serratia marcescens]|uniref:P-type conjugative transfer protein TrbL n=1 Tax=Serratia marcescens TaxID=615 RepID=UPI0009A47384|nr:P-type conjugative transfer protein TrbL [Serratia marcescens]OPJ92719.1 P-type conjugative transfer protein TrbL [Serratia marcescens]